MVKITVGASSSACTASAEPCSYTRCSREVGANVHIFYKTYSSYTFQRVGDTFDRFDYPPA